MRAGAEHFGGVVDEIRLMPDLAVKYVSEGISEMGAEG